MHSRNRDEESDAEDYEESVSEESSDNDDDSVDESDDSTPAVKGNQKQSSQQSKKKQPKQTLVFNVSGNLNLSILYHKTPNILLSNTSARKFLAGSSHTIQTQNGTSPGQTTLCSLKYWLECKNIKKLTTSQECIPLRVRIIWEETS